MRAARSMDCVQRGTVAVVAPLEVGEVCAINPWSSVRGGRCGPRRAVISLEGGPFELDLEEVPAEGGVLLPDVVDAAASSAGKRVTSLGAPRGAGEDQPLDPAFPEGNYLSVCVVRVG